MSSSPYNDDTTTTTNNNNNSRRSTTTSSPPPQNSTMISPELKEYYSNHGVEGIDEFLLSSSSSFAGNDKNKMNGDGETASSSSSTTTTTTRFIRLNPRFDKDETLDMLKNELIQQQQQQQQGSQHFFLVKVPWLHPQLGFYAIHGKFSLSTSTCFQNGRIYGMDVSSGAAVAALLWDIYDVRNVEDQHSNDGSTKSESILSSVLDATIKDPIQQQQELPCTTNDIDSIDFRVLDLCCSPGLKLCTIADMLSSKSNISSSSTVVGVDISEHRIALCKNIVKKYHIDSTTSGWKSSAVAADACTRGIHVKKKNDTANDAIHSVITTPNVNIRLYKADGTTFGTSSSKQQEASSMHHPSLIFDSIVAFEENAVTGKRKRMNKSARARERKRLKERSFLDMVSCSSINDVDASGSDAEKNNNIGEGKKMIDTNSDDDDNVTMKQFDRVLVDAECSTDGAIRHLQKKQSSKSYKQKQHRQDVPSKNEDEKAAAVSDTNKCSSSSAASTTTTIIENTTLSNKQKLIDLINLQRSLILNGFKLLKPGGIMVYSTCSLSSEQNEDVVSWLLDQYRDDDDDDDEAFIIPVAFEDAKSLSAEWVKSSYKDGSAGSFVGKEFATEGLIGGTVRFRPSLHLSRAAVSSAVSEEGDGNDVVIQNDALFGGGFFLAKIGKKLNRR